MPAPIRITGIVRLAESVSRELSRPQTPERQRALRDLVAGRLRQIEGLLKQHGTAESQLPARSRNAMAQLRWTWQTRLAENALPASSLAPASASAPAAAPETTAARSKAANPAPSAVSLPAPSPPAAPARTSTRYNAPGLSRRMEYVLRSLAHPVTHAQAELFRQSIEQTSRQIEVVIRQRAISSAQMSDTFRANRAWVALMSQPGRLARYRQAQHALREALLQLDMKKKLGDLPSIELRPMHGVYKYRFTPHGALIWLPTPMIAFSASDLQAVARMMIRRSASVRQQVLEAINDRPYQSLRLELESLGGSAGVKPGTHHDLTASFDRVNAAFFDGKMSRPQLIWSRSLTHSRMGYYRRASDTLMISRSLDRPDVDASVLDFLMYHELLHKKHGTRWSRGRGYVHTAEFYCDEHRFPGHQQADDRLGELAREALALRR